MPIQNSLLMLHAHPLLSHTTSMPRDGGVTRAFMPSPPLICALSPLPQTMPYRLDEESGYIDYDAMEASASLFRPKLIVAGASAYARHYDYPRMRAVADKHNAFLLADMAHISGLVAAGARRGLLISLWFSCPCCFLQGTPFGVTLEAQSSEITASTVSLAGCLIQGWCTGWACMAKHACTATSPFARCSPAVPGVTGAVQDIRAQACWDDRGAACLPKQASCPRPSTCQ